MAKINTNGRSTRTPFIKLHRGVTNSSAWKTLSCQARCLVLIVWERHNGMNNGQIPLSRREARLALRVGNTKTEQTFQQAQEHGFLIERAKGSFTWKVGAGQGRATEWEITTEPCDRKPPKMLYKKWEKQNTASDAGTTGTQSRNRSSKTDALNDANGSQSGNRYARFQQVSGS